MYDKLLTKSVVSPPYMKQLASKTLSQGITIGHKPFTQKTTAILFLRLRFPLEITAWKCLIS